MILTFLSGLWSKVWAYVVAGGAVIALLLGMYLKGRQDASTAAKINEINQNYKNLKEANKIEQSINSIPDADLDKRLSKWMRD